MVANVASKGELLIGQISNNTVSTAVLGIVFLLILVFLSYRKRPSRARVFKKDMWLETPLIRSDWLTSLFGTSDSVAVNLKLDALQPSGSFKIRGISAFMKQVYEADPAVDTFVTTSSANAGAAVAFTAKQLNCRCLMILDETQKDNELLPLFKQRYGAVVEFHGAAWNEADDYALKLVSKNALQGRYRYVPMYDHPLIFKGHSTLIPELAQQYRRQSNIGKSDIPDCIVVSVGGGGLLCGVLAGLYQVGWTRNVKVVAAQMEQSALLNSGIRNSFQPTPTKCVSADGVELGYRAIAAQALRFVEKFAEFNPIESMVVKNSQVLDACTKFAQEQHILIEPLCGVAVAAVLNNPEYFKQFNSICIVVCGGNHVYYQSHALSKTYDDNRVSAPNDISSDNLEEEEYDIHEDEQYASSEEDI
eukprot:CAMPEP_0202688518 /NCGR_PEP_ID=MMETSP1385-20130828/4016_1 /ASSEMBLY_ACC=CAM_ASM_000861 /TAXON_ID=933848 /ORGANISM="Elphidium margaritaceum" /LENGTH=418 /DNA_ID=CAMNT_0049343511 /DNA_START=52 /DNA_END=1308 /DNA_ORIENTATION=-